MGLVFKKYGPVWVASSIVLGAITWTGVEMYLRGQRVAELLAGYRERSLVAYSSGTDAPALFTDEPSGGVAGITIGPYLLLKDYGPNDTNNTYVYSDIMEPARDLFKENPDRVISPSTHMMESMDPMWILDPSVFYDGAYPVTADYSPLWHVASSNEYVWPLVSNLTGGSPTSYTLVHMRQYGDISKLFDLDYTAADTVWDSVYSTSVRWPWAGSLFVNADSSTNLPFSDYLTYVGAAYGDDALHSPLSNILNADGPWADIGLGTNYYTFVAEIIDEGGVLTGDLLPYSMRTNIVQTFRLLSSLTTSVEIVTVQNASALTNITVTTSGVDSGGGGYSSGSGTSVLPSLSGKATLLGYMSASLDEDAVTNTPVSSLSQTVASHYFYIDEFASYEYMPDSSYYFTNHEYGTVYSGSSEEYYGITLPRPSEFACASGYVSRVEIYGVFASGVDNTSSFAGPETLAFSPVWWPEDGWENQYWDTLTMQEDTQADSRYDAGLNECSLPSVPVSVFSSGSDRFDTYRGAPFRPRTFVTALLHSEDNPSTRPSFDLTAAGDVLLDGTDGFSETGWSGERDIDMTDAPDVDTWSEITDPNRYVQEYQARTYHGANNYTLGLLCFIVVTHYDWDHCNVNSDFVVTTNRPSYLE